MKELFKRLGANFAHLSSLQHWKSQLALWVSGLLVGVVCIGLAMAADFAQNSFMWLQTKAKYAPLIITPLGFALTSWVTKKWFEGAKGSGIPQVIAAGKLVSSDNKAVDFLLSVRTALGKVVLLLIGLLCGASVGREGPSVQIGAAIMRKAARFGGALIDEKALIYAGGAAGVAAAFNTPLAGVVFAIEELGKSFEQKTSGTILLSVMLSGVVSLALIGNYTYFGIASAHTSGLGDVAAVLVCGIGGGLLGGTFSNLNIYFSRNLGNFFGGLFVKKNIYFAAGCGLVVALIGVISGTNVFGTGYNEAKNMLTGSGHVAQGFGFLKFLANLSSSLSGIPGGIFAPSLSAGAGLGSDLHFIVPMVPLTTMALLGMVGYFTGVVQAPLTTMVVVMEMTDDHNMIIPIIATSLLAFSVSRLVCRKPLYHSLALGFIRNNKSNKD